MRRRGRRTWTNGYPATLGEHCAALLSHTAASYDSPAAQYPPPAAENTTAFPTGYGKSICYQLLPFAFDVKLGRTNAPLVEFLLSFPLCLIVHGYYFPYHLSVFSLKIYNCFTACFTVEFTIAPDTPIYNQYQAVFFARRAVILAKNRPGDEARAPIDVMHLYFS